jgi:hypothetical protein
MSWSFLNRTDYRMDHKSEAKKAYFPSEAILFLENGTA